MWLNILATGFTVIVTAAALRYFYPSAPAAAKHPRQAKPVTWDENAQKAVDVGKGFLSLFKGASAHEPTQRSEAEEQEELQHEEYEEVQHEEYEEEEEDDGDE